MPLTSFDTTYRDPNIIRRFGNLTTTSNSEVLVCARGYTEPASAAQRSIVSTSVQDASGGSGAKKVNLLYLNNDYVQSEEVITLNGTTAVDTVSTTVRFIQDFYVIEGSAAAGAIKIMSSTGGGGSEITGIGVGTETAFLCHQYIPAGRIGWVKGWGAVIDDECAFKLKGQTRYSSGGLVDENWDLYRLFLGNPTPPYTMSFYKELCGLPIGEKTYVRVTVVPNQTSSTVIRATLDIYQE